MGVTVDHAEIQRRIYKFTTYIEAIFSSSSRYSSQSFSPNTSKKVISILSQPADLKGAFTAWYHLIIVIIL